jgi:hypothetical protein
VDTAWWDEARESTISTLSRDLVAEARLSHDLDTTRARIERSRRFLKSLESAREDQETPEQAGLVLVADRQGSNADREKILTVMRGSTRLNAWRASQVGERLGRTDTGSIRSLMEQMASEGELVRSSDRRYRLPSQAAAARDKPAM